MPWIECLQDHNLNLREDMIMSEGPRDCFAQKMPRLKVSGWQNVYDGLRWNQSDRVADFNKE